MVAQRIFHWKHGWIPLDHYAMVEQERGRPSAAKVAKPRLPSPVPGMANLSPSLQGKINDKLEQMTGMPEPQLRAKVQNNLLQHYQNGNRADLGWYANQGAAAARAAADIRSATGSRITAEQLIGMVAVTSAQKRWQENLALATGIARKLAEDKSFDVTPEMISDYNAFTGKRKSSTMVPHPDLTPGTYKPSELPVDFAASKTPGMPKLKNTDYAVSAARIYRGASLDEVIGGPKQRSFANNLLVPADPGSVTVDTWHYRAAMAGIPLTRTVGPKGQAKTYSYTLEQWADRDLARTDGRAAMFGYDFTKPPADAGNVTIILKATLDPQTFFQGGPASKADGYDGKYGTYPWFVRQTQAAAQQAGVNPAGLQAVVWYTVGGGL